MQNNDKIQIVIADDHPVSLRGLRNVIEADSELKVIAEVGDGASALARIRELKPDVAVLDVNMPQADGFEVVREMQKLNLNTQVIFLTMYKDEGLFNQAMDLGVKGYILKDSAIDEIVSSIKTAAAGENFTSPPLTTFLVKRSNRHSAFVEKIPSVKDLTKTELRILKLIAEEKTSKEIADILCISYSAVETHRHNICIKLDIHEPNALLKFALLHKSEILQISV